MNRYRQDVSVRCHQCNVLNHIHDSDYETGVSCCCGTTLKHLKEGNKTMSNGKVIHREKVHTQDPAEHTCFYCGHTPSLHRCIITSEVVDNGAKTLWKYGAYCANCYEKAYHCNFCGESMDRELASKNDGKCFLCKNPLR